MVFSSNLFLFIFLPATLIGYYLIRKEFRNTFLMIMSLGFYAWGEPRVVFIMIGVTLMDYLFGLLIDWVKRKEFGRLALSIVLFVTVAANLSALFYFKYFDFFVGTFNSLAGTNIPLRHIVLPIGISFFTFQAMSYVLDVYMGSVKVQRNPLNIILYISLFPQLIAGPIVRYKDVNDEIDNRTCTVDDFAAGIRRFVIGLSKKVIIANAMGKVADSIFALPYQEISWLTSWLGAVTYMMQIYFDFSGYSDMAIGLGRMFGFHFLENFNYPYISRTVTEFWRRWHISLSTWFRDYVYIPLGGNRRGNQYVNLTIVFLLTGLWHGSAWNFVIWGLWHGAFLIIEKLLMKKGILQKIPYALNWILTMLVVIVGWVLFRAESLQYAVGYLGVMFGAIQPHNIRFSVEWFATNKVLFILFVGAIASVPWKQVFSGTTARLEGAKTRLLFEFISVTALLCISLMLSMTSTYNPFIYFRF